MVAGGAGRRIWRRAARISPESWPEAGGAARGRPGRQRPEVRPQGARASGLLPCATAAAARASCECGHKEAGRGPGARVRGRPRRMLVAGRGGWSRGRAKQRTTRGRGRWGWVLATGSSAAGPDGQRGCRVRRARQGCVQRRRWMRDRGREVRR